MIKLMVKDAIRFKIKFTIKYLRAQFGGGEGAGYGMVWFWLLGLSASVLAGREAGFPHNSLVPGQP